MSVVGLPTAVKVVLEALLTENQLTSWKVSAEGSKTVVVLRLTSPETAAITTPTTQPSTEVRYRRKPPSQITGGRYRPLDYYYHRKTTRYVTHLRVFCVLGVASWGKILFKTVCLFLQSV
ncbi:hypothetical protein V1264_013460 [Littorina saxatilis]|uniref:Uncharacterized protein n=1 Tax=Littorina saxatilis TaxID=31220 RepID=A0AAN9GHT2_9CAEN